MPEESVYCGICFLRVAPYDPQRFHLNGQLFHRSCVAAEMAKPKAQPDENQLPLFKGKPERPAEGDWDYQGGR